MCSKGLQESISAFNNEDDGDHKKSLDKNGLSATLFFFEARGKEEKKKKILLSNSPCQTPFGSTRRSPSILPPLRSSVSEEWVRRSLRLL
jgi:hypothetical protein